MFEEIRMAYQIAKKLKSVEWEVKCYELGNGEVRVVQLHNPEYGSLWTGNGWLGLCHGDDDSDSPLAGIGLLSETARQVIWYFGGLSSICQQHYVSAETNSKRKLKEIQEKLIKRT